MLLYEALETQGNIIRDSCLGKHVLELGSGSGLLARPLEQVAAGALLTDLPECIDNCQHNIGENCSSAAVSCCALDVSVSSELDAAALWSFDVLLGADVCYDIELVHQVVRAFKVLLRGQSLRKGYLLSTRRSDETSSTLSNMLSSCEDDLNVNDVTSLTKHHLGKFPFSFWDYCGVVVYEITAR